MFFVRSSKWIEMVLKWPEIVDKRTNSEFQFYFSYCIKNSLYGTFFQIYCSFRRFLKKRILIIINRENPFRKVWDTNATLFFYLQSQSVKRSLASEKNDVTQKSGTYRKCLDTTTRK